jgi:hypothetical protein
LCASVDELSKIFVGHRRKIDRVLMTERVCRIAANRHSLEIRQDLLAEMRIAKECQGSVAGSCGDEPATRPSAVG